MEALKLNSNEEACERECIENVCKTLTWDDVKWMRSISKLPIVLKGILSGILNFHG